MRKLFLSFGLLLAICSIAVSQNNIPKATYDEGVVINGVKWATRNVGRPGTFAPTSNSQGGKYQWNSKIECDSIDWSQNTPTGDTWEKSNDPSPAGWRVPTIEEIQTLLNKDKVRVVHIKNSGMRFIDKATGKSIFLPFNGSCFSDDNKRGIDVTDVYIMSSASYWSNLTYDTVDACGLSFLHILYDFGDVSSDIEWICNIKRGVGHCIRSVAE
ncbi:MAG: hypothetical protein FWC39_03250 [Bacteroidetes bacterium]|nr:hypothetical protein [Bacteroidota bacterium]